MKNCFFTYLVFLLFGSSLFAQTTADSISLKRNKYGDYIFYQHGKKVSFDELSDLMVSNKKASEQIKASKINSNTAFFINSVGAGVIGYNFAQVVLYQKPAWKWVGVGAAVCVLSIPILKMVKRDVKSAVETFNSGLKAPTPSVGYQFGFGLQQNGLGLALRF